MNIKIIDGDVTNEGWDLLESILNYEFENHTYDTFYEGCVYWDGDSFVLDFLRKNGDEYGEHKITCNFINKTGSQENNIHWCMEERGGVAYFILKS